MARIKIEDIRAELVKENWKVISEEYTNLETEMIFECSEGHKVYAPWKKIRQKRTCPVCENNQYKKIENLKIPQRAPGQKIVLALDQSTKITGYSIYYDQSLIYYGIYNSTISNNAAARNNDIKNWIINMIQNWKPDLIGIEGIQFQAGAGNNMGVTVFETLARLQGVIIDACYELKIPLEIVHTAVWRGYCGVKGKTRADKKRSMQFLVKDWFDITVSDDEADAIGIGKYFADELAKSRKAIIWE